MTRAVVRAAVAVALVAPAAARGQTVAVSVPAEAQVRVETTSGSRASGRVIELRSDTLLLRTRASAPERLAMADVRALWVRGGRDRRRGALIGAGATTVITGVFGGIDYARHDIGGGELAGAIAGNAVFGALVGYLLAPKGWLRVPLGR